MGKIPERTSLKISDFLFRFRESSKRFVVEILTQNTAFNLSGALFLIGISCSLKWWYKDQLLIVLLKQNLPAFSAPQQKISWETGEFLIGEQTRQFVEKKRNLLLNINKSTATCTPTELVLSIHQLTPTKLVSTLMKQVSESTFWNASKNHKIYEIGPQYAEMYAHPFDHLIERIDVYSNSVLINFKSPWEKHAYHRFVGIFPELVRAGTLDLMKSPLSFTNSSPLFTNIVDKNSWESKVKNKKLKSDNLSKGFVAVNSSDKKVGAKTTTFSLQKYTFWEPPKNWFKVSARGLCILNENSFLEPTIWTFFKKPIVRTLPLNSFSEMPGKGKVVGSTTIANSTILKKGLGELSTVLANRFLDDGINLALTEITDSSDKINRSLKYPQTIKIKSKSVLKSKNLKPILTAFDQSKKLTIIGNISYPLELTTTMGGWQPPVETLILNSYLDEIPYKLESTLSSLLCKKENQPVSLILKSDSLLVDQKIKKYPITGLSTAKNCTKEIQPELLILFSDNQHRCSSCFVESKGSVFATPSKLSAIWSSNNYCSPMVCSLVDGTIPFTNSIGEQVTNSAIDDLMSRFPFSKIANDTSIADTSFHFVDWEEKIKRSLESNKKEGKNSSISWSKINKNERETFFKNLQLIEIKQLLKKELQNFVNSMLLIFVDRTSISENFETNLRFDIDLGTRPEETKLYKKLYKKQPSKSDIYYDIPGKTGTKMQQLPPNFSQGSLNIANKKELIDDFSETEKSLSQLSKETDQGKEKVSTQQKSESTSAFHKKGGFDVTELAQSTSGQTIGEQVTNSKDFSKTSPNSVDSFFLLNSLGITFNNLSSLKHPPILLPTHQDGSFWMWNKQQTKKVKNQKENIASYITFRFDPNTLTWQVLQQLGCNQLFEKSKTSFAFINQILLKQTKTTVENIDDINPVDNEINLKKNQTRLMSGYIYPDTQSNFLKSNLYCWIQFKFFKFLEDQKAIEKTHQISKQKEKIGANLTPKGETFPMVNDPLGLFKAKSDYQLKKHNWNNWNSKSSGNPNTRKSDCISVQLQPDGNRIPQKRANLATTMNDTFAVMNAKFSFLSLKFPSKKMNKHLQGLSEIQIKEFDYQKTQFQNWLIYPKLFRGITRFLDQACLFGVEIPNSPSTIPFHALYFQNSQPDTYALSYDQINGIDSQEKRKLSFPLINEVDPCKNEKEMRYFDAAFPLLKNKIGTIHKKLNGNFSEFSGSPTLFINDGDKKKTEFVTCSPISLTLAMTSSTDEQKANFVVSEQVIKVENQNQGTCQRDDRVKETDQWKFDHRFASFPGFTKPNQFLVSLSQIAQGNDLSEDVFSHFYDVSLNKSIDSINKRRSLGTQSIHNVSQNKKNSSSLDDCNPRKTAYRGIVAQRDPYTKDFQSPKKTLKLRSIWGISLFGPENPFTDQQSHFFGQRRLSTVDVHDFQRDYLRQLGKETLVQSNPKGFPERTTSVERVKILSFSKALNSFFSKKQKYTYLLEEKDQWHLLFQEQLRTALEDTRKYSPSTPEEAKSQSSSRIKVSAPLMMARFPKKPHSHKVLAHLKENQSKPVLSVHQLLSPTVCLLVDWPTSIINCTPAIKVAVGEQVKVVGKQKTVSNGKFSENSQRKYDNQLFTWIIPAERKWSIEMPLRSVQSLGGHRKSMASLSADIVTHYPIFTETSSSQFSYAPWLQKNLLPAFNNWQWFAQEPLNSNSWLIISQWSFLIALFFWLEQTFLADIFPALFALEQLLLGATGIKSGDRTHAIRVSKSETPKFKDIAGVDGLLGELAELVLFLRGHKERLWSKKSSYGVLLTGPPGTGKTFLVRALANEAKVPVLILSAGGLTANKTNNSKPSWSIRHAFRRAKQLAPCILFIDEIDALGRSRGKIATDINEIVADTNFGQNQRTISTTPLSNSKFFGIQNSWNGVANRSSFTSGDQEQPLSPQTHQRQGIISPTTELTKSMKGSVFGSKTVGAYSEIDRYSLCEDEISCESSTMLMNRKDGSKIANKNSFILKNQEQRVNDRTQSIPNEKIKRKFGPLTQLLVSMDGVSSLSGVLIMGATNRPESLDPALTRPGRFERVIRVEKPAEQKRIEILQLYSRNLGIQQQIPWFYLANRTVGLTAADLSVAMNYSSLKAILQGTAHTIETIEYGLDSIARFSSTSSMKNKISKGLHFPYTLNIRSLATGKKQRLNKSLEIQKIYETSFFADIISSIADKDDAFTNAVHFSTAEFTNSLFTNYVGDNSWGSKVSEKEYYFSPSTELLKLMRRNNTNKYTNDNTNMYTNKIGVDVDVVYSSKSIDFDQTGVDGALDFSESNNTFIWRKRNSPSGDPELVIKLVQSTSGQTVDNQKQVKSDESNKKNLKKANSFKFSLFKNEIFTVVDNE